MENIRPPAVAGSFYPANPAVLTDMIEDDLAHATSSFVNSTPMVLIVPHAGYIYSGPIAASAFIHLKPYRELIKHVVILGPSHRVGFMGMAISSADYFETPLGIVPLDKNKQAKLQQISGVKIIDEAHVAEHSLEVQIPFLQYLLDEFSIVPIVAGNASPNLVAKVIETLWGGNETLLIISSDLSHYHNYQDAQRLDQATSIAIVSQDVHSIDSTHACGCIGIKGLLTFSLHHPLKATVLDVRNSGDTAGSKDSVVGYGSYLFTELDK